MALAVWHHSEGNITTSSSILLRLIAAVSLWLWLTLAKVFTLGTS